MTRWIGLVLLLGAGLGLFYYWEHREEPLPSFRTSRIERGAVAASVTATGVVEPITLVQVGSQISGTIAKINVDFNDRVKRGQVICELDQTALRATVSQDRANLSKAKANVRRVKAELAVAEKDLDRAKRLNEKNLISDAELDRAEANYRALAAQLEVADAEVNQVQSSLDRAVTNLGYATIRSPIDGVVVLRNVDVGQTVAASLQAPVLFEIAENMDKMYVQASVGESDIGMVRNGQPVRFTVDAYTDREFTGEVLQIRLSPRVEQNVVTYTVMVSAENPDQLLMPGMTANLQIEVGKSPDGALRVPNLALRFEPDQKWLTAGVTLEPETSKSGRPIPRVWVLNDEHLRPIPLKIGLTDKTFSEILDGEIHEGQEVIVGVQEGPVKQVNIPFQRQQLGASKSKSRN
jgi:HlyD family secretion protein